MISLRKLMFRLSTALVVSITLRIGARNSKSGLPRDPVPHVRYTGEFYPIPLPLHGTISSSTSDTPIVPNSPSASPAFPTARVTKTAPEFSMPPVGRSNTRQPLRTPPSRVRFYNDPIQHSIVDLPDNLAIPHLPHRFVAIHPPVRMRIRELCPLPQQDELGKEWQPSGRQRKTQIEDHPHRGSKPSPIDSPPRTSQNFAE